MIRSSLWGGGSMKWYYAAILLLMAFLYRLFFGLFSEFWFEDELQIYLIGLHFYSSGAVPAFGPDVVYTSSQIPGALQGLLVGLPFYIWPAPEAPYILLNLLNSTALCLFAAYIDKRFPQIPAWFIWGWLLTCPWTLNFGTHVLNPSYVLPAAIAFFVGFIEALPATSSGRLKSGTCFFMMGISLLWIFQLHLSWVLLVPFVATAWILNGRSDLKKLFYNALIFITGCLIPGILLLPALLQEGWSGFTGGTGGNMILNWKNLLEFPTVLSRFLSLASMEIPRFMGADTNSRLDFLNQYIWAAPFIIVAGIIGLVQPLWMIVSAFLKQKRQGFRPILLITAIAFLWVWMSFLFSVKGPSSHTFYLMFPLVMIYSLYCWQPLFRKKWFRVLALVFLICGFVFHSVLMQYNFNAKSLYRDRERVQHSITTKQPAELGTRRAFDRNQP